jgi:hypothetical protein
MMNAEGGMMNEKQCLIQHSAFIIHRFFAEGRGSGRGAAALGGARMWEAVVEPASRTWQARTLAN